MSGRFCKAGDYVAYKPSVERYVVSSEQSGYQQEQIFNPSQNTLWRVYWEDDDEIHLISSRNVGALMLEGRTGFAGSVGTLNKLCGAFVNPAFAVSGRCLGSSEKSVETLKLETCSAEYFENASAKERVLYSEAECEIDLAWLRASKLMEDSNRYIWMASRSSKEGLFNTVQFGTTVWNGKHDKKESVCLYKAYKCGGGYNYRASYGVRPIIVLRRDVNFVSGDGTKKHPYRLAE